MKKLLMKSNNADPTQQQHDTATPPRGKTRLVPRPRGRTQKTQVQTQTQAQTQNCGHSKSNPPRQSGDVRGCGRGYFKKTRHRRAGAYAGVGARRDGPTTIRKHGTLKSQMCISSLAFRTDGPSRVPGLATAVAMLFCGILVWVGEGFKEGK